MDAFSWTNCWFDCARTLVQQVEDECKKKYSVYFGICAEFIITGSSQNGVFQAFLYIATFLLWSPQLHPGSKSSAAPGAAFAEAPGRIPPARSARRRGGKSGARLAAPSVCGGFLVGDPDLGANGITLAQHRAAHVRRRHGRGKFSDAFHVSLNLLSKTAFYSRYLVKRELSEFPLLLSFYQYHW